MRQAIGYVRVSTSEQVSEGVSLEMQRAKISAWCVANDYELVGVFEDAGISGASMDKRPGLTDAVAGAKRGMALVTYSISRLARSTKDMISIADGLERKGADLVSLSEKIDTTSASGRMIFRMLAVLAEFERDQIAERTKGALRHKKASMQVYNHLPLGFSGVDGRLVPLDEETLVVAEILALRADGKSLREIAAELNDRGIVGKRGGVFYASTIKGVLDNDIHRRAA